MEEVHLIRIAISDAEKLLLLQKEAFKDLLDKYHDFETNPGNESLEKIEAKLKQKETYFYYICADSAIVGAVRVVDRKDGSRKRVAPIFIMKDYRGKGFAQKAFYQIEKIHGQNHWKLDTILQEAGNCYLYEKLGYQKTGEIETINEKMDIVYFEKD
ncbi:GNAT family N-acetyltransferase [Streptococcus merionis]|uniref:Histone acetyltransferase HPA2-like acetyltransferase n=1 Tax=Streptococcus merionis TaxID=400065 RepID=A0A239SVE4_9STRE|nr:GNAT family N-acetyltransferase [Streptococcus merionis]SNU88563.1 histone acetyltransferase HPA2-like acetyltransferase [Streptococcus merionis]